ncbi:NAD(P)H-dependent oxidoreductase [Vibrio sp. SM6]|uniref:NAD(P)H-dependent oxidoreductase n=1 Tax=Vibrio agarilyticus TaxID=2726741 RepID=A0A7X8YG59_9VIBR|nr:NAD(P)H-dependent oxidoreductase [Vibrio agarilyticus]NLS12071.1 NAD(P)H-dependent oxidoreductase [Vibrio agarilyticus]
MSNVLIINGHQPYPFSEGKLNASLVELAERLLRARGYDIRITTVAQGWNIEQELENHQWADVVLLQTPTNWMTVPWLLKQYMDEVYTAGMGGALCNGDGRMPSEPKAHYGEGGTLNGKRYMLSLTFNAPAEAFNDQNEYLFQGKSVDDLWFPIHMNFRFFGMQGLPTFACHDVMKNPEIESDLARFEAHINWVL